MNRKHRRHSRQVRRCRMQHPRTQSLLLHVLQIEKRRRTLQRAFYVNLKSKICSSSLYQESSLHLQELFGLSSVSSLGRLHPSGCCNPSNQKQTDQENIVLNPSKPALNRLNDDTKVSLIYCLELINISAMSE